MPIREKDIKINEPYMLRTVYSKSKGYRYYMMKDNKWVRVGQKLVDYLQSLQELEYGIHTSITKRSRDLFANPHFTGTQKRPGRFVMTFKIFCTVAEYIVIFGAIVIMCALLAEVADDY